MKKSIIFGTAILAALSFVSCNKENVTESPKPVKVSASTELPNDAQTKVSIVESGSNFSLNWQGTETFVVCNSTNKNGGAGISGFSVDSYSGSNAVFTGTLPSVTGSTTNYMAAFNWISSTDDYCRAEIPSDQTYSPDGALATNCLLVARTDDATVGTLTSLDFKTMNAFMKFSFKKGSHADGSSNSYSKMYVQNIKIETVNKGEVLAGRFGFNKTGAWGTAYDEVVTANKKDIVSLNCVTGAFSDGVELDPDTATDFFIAIAFGSFTQGLKVTVMVKNDTGDYGTYTRTISNNSNYDVARNTLIAMPALVVNPDDYVVETYTLVEDIAHLTAGQYIMCAVKDGYKAFTGSFSSGNGVTESVTYNSDTKVLTYTNAKLLTFTSTGTPNQYKISWPYSTSTDYLTSTANNKLAYTTDAEAAELWTASDVTTGMVLLGSINSGYIRTAPSAASNNVRSYSSTGSTGIVLFKKN